MARVLPLPAPARIKTGPCTVSAASRCWGLSSLRRFRLKFTTIRCLSRSVHPISAEGGWHESGPTPVPRSRFFRRCDDCHELAGVASHFVQGVWPAPCRRSTSYRDLKHLILAGFLGCFHVHGEAPFDGFIEILQQLFKAIALSSAAWNGRNFGPISTL